MNFLSMALFMVLATGIHNTHGWSDQECRRLGTHFLEFITTLQNISTTGSNVTQRQKNDITLADPASVYGKLTDNSEYGYVKEQRNEFKDKFMDFTKDRITFLLDSMTPRSKRSKMDAIKRAVETLKTNIDSDELITLENKFDNLPFVDILRNP